MTTEPTPRDRPLRIGTRGSPLALAQAREVRERLIAAHADLAAPGAVEIVPIKTTGDRVQDRPLSQVGGKGVFTKEIEEALLDGRIDFAVHSMKDMPTFLPDGLAITCLLPREDPRDALFAREGDSLATLPAGAVVGTASLRRQAQVLALRPDLRVVNFRGNVGSRLRKLEAGEVDATLLALAGLRRLGLAHEATAVLETEEMLPAVAQGAIGIETRADDAAVLARLTPLNDRATAICVAAERGCLAELDGSCHTPIAALAELDPDGTALRLRALIALPDGSVVHRDERRGTADRAAELGRTAGAALKAKAEPAFFQAMA
ncbi:hydroxymethylbilane synthase [Rhodospirillaceae bacterium SYSU D60014]|uniref:hydroxymethylbilane synthase n=1 Tax=Virgifigura deserti TaxID=2268457 RepID=UPI000E6696C7